MNSEKDILICIPADVKRVRDTVKKIISFIESNHIYDKNFIFETKVILNELIVNSIIHGSNGDTSKNVSVKVGICKQNNLYAIIADQGTGPCCNSVSNYNPCDAISNDDFVDIDICKVKESGRGLQIAKALCDCIKCNKRGNVFVIRKKLP